MHLLFGPDGSRRYAHHHGITYREALLRLERKIVDIADWSKRHPLVTELSVWLYQDYNLWRNPVEAQAIIAYTESLVGHFLKCSKGEGLRPQLVGEYAGTTSTLDRLAGDLAKETYSAESFRVNIIAAYNSDKELERSIGRCQSDGVKANFKNISERWSFPPVDLFFRTGLSKGFVKLSSYWPYVERAKLLSSPLPPQEITKAMLDVVVHNAATIKDSFSAILPDRSLVKEKYPFEVVSCP